MPVFDWGEDGGTYFIVMEYVDGRPLSSILRTAGPLHPDRAAEIAADVAAALFYAHRHGVVHRDVKPGNVLITDEGMVKVTDFGIARAVNTEESLTQTGAVMGTATYFSPEQAEGLGVDARSDIYSLGVVLFEMVTGRPPFLGESPVAVASKHVREDVPAPRSINPAVPSDLEAVILKCLAKSPDYRYATAEDLRVDLLRFREGRAVSAGAVPPTALQAALGTTSVLGATSVMGAVGPAGTQALPVMDRTVVEAGPSSRTGVYVTVLLVLLAALGVVLFFLGRSLGWWGGASASTFTMPDVSSMTVADATAKLQGLGLKVTTQVDPNAPTVPDTQVTGTRPPKGATVHKGESVVILTGGQVPQTSIAITDYTGQAVGFAQQQLQKAGFNPQIQYSATCTQQNIVCDQNPKSGSYPPGTTVTLVTAQPPPGTVAVPNVVGESVSAACSAITGANLQCGQVTQQCSNTTSSGEVSATTPPPGTQVASGTSVALVESNGPCKVAVPNVITYTYSQAVDAITAVGLVPVVNCVATPIPPSNGQQTEVTSQSPTGGTEVNPGTSVDLTVESYPTANCANPGTTTTVPGSTTTTAAHSGPRPLQPAAQAASRPAMV